MDESVRAIDTRGRVVDARHIETDADLPVGRQVRVVVLLSPADDAIPEGEWLAAAARNPAFGFLADAAEDIYSLEDGEPFVRS
jgi:hypothetical protein